MSGKRKVDGRLESELGSLGIYADTDSLLTPLALALAAFRFVLYGMSLTAR